eukprot:11979875-Karenia_brevis.AAC.1
MGQAPQSPEEQRLHESWWRPDENTWPGFDGQAPCPVDAKVKVAPATTRARSVLTCSCAKGCPQVAYRCHAEISERRRGGAVIRAGACEAPVPRGVWRGEAVPVQRALRPLIQSTLPERQLAGSVLASVYTRICPLVSYR